jgi:Rrf2 family protein
MIDLAEHHSGEFIPLEEIAERQDVSKKYLEQILPPLVSGGLIEGARGKGGGYRLSRAPAEYTVAEVLYLTEGSLASVACLNHTQNPCPRAPACKTLPMWQEFWKRTKEYFEGITIIDLVRNPASEDWVI